MARRTLDTLFSWWFRTIYMHVYIILVISFTVLSFQILDLTHSLDHFENVQEVLMNYKGEKHVSFAF